MLVVGTYRMQMGDVAKQYFGYYSEQEFCFAPYESMRNKIVELGRACIHRDYRSSDVLHLLWRGIARYALVNGARYMVGCCSLTSQDPETGHAVYATLQGCMVAPELRTVATAPYALPDAKVVLPDVQAPKLLRAYLTIGAKICSGPAIDREFKTIGFSGLYLICRPCIRGWRNDFLKDRGPVCWVGCGRCRVVKRRVCRDFACGCCGMVDTQAEAGRRGSGVDPSVVQAHCAGNGIPV